MAQLNKTDLKAIFKEGAVPTEAQFASLIDSQINTVDTSSQAPTGSSGLVESSVLSPAQGFFNLKSSQPFLGLTTTRPTTGSGMSMHAGLIFNVGQPYPNNPFIKTNGGFDIFMDNANQGPLGADTQTEPLFRVYRGTAIAGINPGVELLKLNQYGGLKVIGAITSSIISASDAITAGALTVTGTTTFTSAQVGQRLTKRVLTTTNETLTAAESGKLCLFSDADGATAVLPDSGNGSLVGVYYDFYVAEQLTSGNYNIKCTDTTNEAIIGFLHFCDIDTNPAVSEFTWRALASDSYDQIQMNGTTTGTVGTFFRITNIAPDKWMVNGSLMATGTPATPFVAN